MGAGFARFGRELGEALRRGREAGRQVGDRPLKRKRQRVALAAQTLQIGVVEVLVPERSFNGGERRAGLVEIERVGFLRASAPKAHEDEDEDDPAQ